MAETANDAAEVPSPQDRQSRAATIAAGIIVLLIFLTPAAGFFWLRAMSGDLAERSLLSHAGDVLLRHVARTRGEWPRSWDDLADDFEPEDTGYQAPNLDVIKRAVEIDFEFDPNSEFDEDHPPLRVIWLKNRPDTDTVRMTNARLEETLRQRRSRDPAP